MNVRTPGISAPGPDCYTIVESSVYETLLNTDSRILDNATGEVEWSGGRLCFINGPNEPRATAILGAAGQFSGSVRILCGGGD